MIFQTAINQLIKKILAIVLKTKIIEFFVNVDDFCKEIVPELEKQFIEDYSLGKRNRKSGLCNSEIITLMIAFHAALRCFPLFERNTF